MIGRTAGLLLLGLLAGCQARRPGPPQATAIETPCGGDRAVADRGIGGTGAGAGPETADRGIGGTGIVGVVTGFGSVCVNGLELAIAPAANVTVDGAAAQLMDLRVAEVIAVAASGAAPQLVARAIAVRHEVSGPLTWLAPNRAEAEIAGQPVRLEPPLRDAAWLHIGSWVAVSGLRDPNGMIHATRLDPGVPGEVTVVGRLERTRGEWRIGTLELRLAHGEPPSAPRVRLSGRLVAGQLQVATVAAEPLLPTGNRPPHLSIEGFVDIASGKLRLGESVAAIAPDFGAPPAPDTLAIVEFSDTQGEGLVAQHWHPAVSHHAAGASGSSGTAATSDGAGESEGSGSGQGSGSSGGSSGEGEGGGSAGGHSTGHGEGGGSGGGGSGH